MGKICDFNFKGIFRTKFDEGTYSFDVIAVNPIDLSSSLVGFCLVNVITGRYHLSLSGFVNLPEEIKKELANQILDEAKKLEIANF